MGTALYGVDIVDVRVDVLRIVGVVHDSHLDRDALLLGLEIDDIVEEVGAVTVYVAHKLLQTILGMEDLLAGLALGVGARIGQGNADAGVEECQLAHTASHDVPLECGGGEDAAIGPELLACTALVGFAHYLDGVERLALLIFLLVDFSVAEHLRHHVARQGVDTAYAHTVETTADLIRTLVKLTTGVEHGHNHLQSRLVQFFMHIHGDTAAVVFHRYRVVLVDGHFYICAVACHRLVDRVVYRLVNQVMQTLFANIADVHGRALAHCLQAFEYLNVTRRIVAFYVMIIFHFSMVQV